MIIKKIIQNTLLISYLASLLVGNALAQTKTLLPSPEASASPTTVVDRDIQQLKDKIGNKVLEIRKKNNNGEENQIKFDDTLTKYFKITGAQKKEIKVDDIKKNDYAIVSGVVTDNIITANVVLIDEKFLVDSGKITEINKDNYNIKVLTSDKNTYSLDFETNTKQYMINIKTLLKETVGFSKLKEGDTVHFVVKKTGDEKNNNYSALKIMIIPQEYFI